MRFNNLTIPLKTAGVVCAVMTALIATLALISYNLLMVRFGTLEEKELLTQVQRGVNEIYGEIMRLETLNRDWAPWDETYQFVKKLNSDFVINNLSDQALGNLGLNFFLCVDQKDRLFYAHFFDLAGQHQVEPDREVLAALLNEPFMQLHHGSDAHAHRSGLVRTDSGKVLMVSAAPIATSTFAGPLAGTLLMGKYLDDDEVKRISSRVALQINIRVPDPEEASRAALQPGGRILSDAVLIRRLSEQQVAGAVLLSDLKGKPSLVMEVMRNRDFFRSGLTMWRQYAISLLLLGMVSMAVLYFLVNRFVLHKLVTLSQQVDRIADAGKNGLRLPVPGNDEIDRLAGGINTMLDGLEQFRSRQESNEQYLTVLLNSINCGVIVVRVDNRTIVDINRYGAELLNRSREECIGQRCHQFVCSYAQGHCPTLDLHQPVFLAEETMLRFGHGEFPVLKSVTPVVREGVKYLITSFVEISGLKEAQRELVSSEAKYRQFFTEDLTSNSISTLDGRIVDCNPAFARMLGYSSVEEVKQINIIDHYFDPRDREALMDLVQRRQRLERYEWKLRHRNNQPIFCIGNVVGIFDDKGRLQSCRFYIFDDTRRVVLEQDMRQSQKLEAIGTLAGGIAHDFNNILAGIIGYSEIIRRELAGTVTGRVIRYLDNILNAGERARDLIGQIMAFSRQSEAQLRPVLLQRIIEEVVPLIRATLPTTIRLETRLDSKATVMADQVQIHQIIMNLATNAGYAMREQGGLLQFSLDEISLDPLFCQRHVHLQPGNYLRLQVCDNGVGIPGEVQERIFDPFFTTKKKGEGTGLGLSVVHGIVTNMQGLITVTSEPGEGCCFTIYLPAIHQGEVSTVLDEEPLPCGSEHLVLVDDDPFLVEIGRELLEELGYQVTEFHQAAEALAYLRTHHESVDLLITDMTMPDYTGLEIARILSTEGIRLPVILCTGHAEGLGTEQTRRLGIAEVVLKPITARDLGTTIRTVLNAAPSPAPPV